MIAAGTRQGRALLLLLVALAPAGCWMQDYRGTMRVGNDLLGTGGEFAISDEVPGDVMATGVT
ncbi:MAG TPA: hypothetical protein VF178_10030, partial [Gemmatimonadaceae bacterium]